MSDSEQSTFEYDPDADHPYPDERLNEILPVVTSDPEIVTYLEAQNVNAVTRKQYSDHGPKHIEIVRNRALRLYELLKRGGIEFNGATEQGLEESFEPVILALAATLLLGLALTLQLFDLIGAARLPTVVARFKEDRIVARGSHDELEAWAGKQTSVKRPVPA